MSAEDVAESILKQVKKGKYLVLPGFDAKFFYRLSLILGNLRYPYLEYLVSRAQKKKSEPAELPIPIEFYLEKPSLLLSQAGV